MGLYGPDNRRTQKPPGSYSDPDFEKTSGFWENNATGIQRYFKAANGQIFLPELPASFNRILGQLAEIHFKSVER
jgi:hypothetical protein